MPVTLPSIQPLSLDENAPGLYGYLQGQKIAEDNLNQSLNANKLPYVQPAAMADVQRQQLANALSSASLPYAGDMAKANLGLAQMNLALNPFRAFSNYLGNAGKLANIQSALDKTQLAFYQTNQGQQALRKNPADAQAFADIMERQRQTSQNGLLGNLSNIGQRFMPDTSKITSSLGENTGATGLQHNLANSLDPNAQSGLSNLGQALSNIGIAKGPDLSSLSYNAPAPFSPNTQLPTAQTYSQPQESSDITLTPRAKLIQEAANDEYLRKNLTPGALKQLTYSNILDTQLENIKPILSDVAQFSGLAGKAKMSAGKYAQSMNMQSDPRYMNYNTFATEQAPMIANELRRVLGGSQSKYENDLLKSIANPTNWDVSPAQTFKNLNTLIGISKSVIPSLTKTPTDTINTASENAKRPSFDPKSYYEEMDASPKYARSMYTILSPEQRAALKAYHLSQKVGR